MRITVWEDGLYKGGVYTGAGKILSAQIFKEENPSAWYCELCDKQRVDLERFLGDDFTPPEAEIKGEEE